MKLRKSRDNVLLTGLLGGLGEYYDVDPTFIRIGFVFLFFVGAFPVIPLYIIASLLVPQANKTERETNNNKENEQTIDKSSFNEQNIKDLSEQSEISEDDWSDF